MNCRRSIVHADGLLSDLLFSHHLIYDTGIPRCTPDATSLALALWTRTNLTGGREFSGVQRSSECELLPSSLTDTDCAARLEQLHESDICSSRMMGGT